MSTRIDRPSSSIASLSGFTFIEILITLSLLMLIILQNSQAIHAVFIRQQASTLSQTNFSITWTASGRKKNLRFSPSGTAREFGRFNFCNKKDRTLAAQTLVVSRMGKTRRYRDRDQDGYVEDRDSRKPDC